MIRNFRVPPHLQGVARIGSPLHGGFVFKELDRVPTPLMMAPYEELLNEHEKGRVGIALLDHEGRVRAASDGLLEAGGFTADDLLSTVATDFIHPDDLERVVEVLADVFRFADPRPPGLYRIRTGNGTYQHFSVGAVHLDVPELSIAIWFDTPGEDVRSRSLVDDAIDVLRVIAENPTLEDSVAWVLRVGERHAIGGQVVATIFDPEAGPTTVVSPQPIPDALMDVNRQAGADAPPEHVVQAHTDHLASPADSADRTVTSDASWPGRYTSALVGKDDELMGYVEVLRDADAEMDNIDWLVHSMISRMLTALLRRHELDRQLRIAAEQDPLTGLWNRRKLLDEISQADDLTGSLFYVVDLDRFSWINNTLGHAAGDEALVVVATCLRHVSPSAAHVARIGGDEFVVWVPAEASQGVDNPNILAESFREAMKFRPGLTDRRNQVRCSMGVARVEPGEGATDTIRRADELMYSAKRAGGDGIESCSSSRAR